MEPTGDHDLAQPRRGAPREYAPFRAGRFRLERSCHVRRHLPWRPTRPRIVEMKRRKARRVGGLSLGWFAMFIVLALAGLVLRSPKGRTLTGNFSDSAQKVSNRVEDFFYKLQVCAR